MELDAFAVVSACNKLHHFLLGREFEVVVDQQEVSFLLNRKPKSAVKNAKLARKRLQMLDYRFIIVYRRGHLNTVADAVSCCSAISSPLGNHDVIKKLHESMGHHGFRLLRAYLLPYHAISVNEILKVTNDCKICAEVKPRFFPPPLGKLIHATAPWQWISVDFVGPKASNTANHYLFTVIDEYSRYSFAFPVRDQSLQTVISRLSSLFYLFSPPQNVHSDRGAQFESKCFIDFLHSFGVTKSRTTSYHPQGNGEVERMHGTLWKTVTLRLRQARLPMEAWERQLHPALSNLHYLVFRSTGQTSYTLFLGFSRRSLFLDLPIASHLGNLPNPSDGSEPSVPGSMQEGAEALLGSAVHTKEVPLVDPIVIHEVISPHIVWVLRPSGLEEAVSFRRIAPYPRATETTPVAVLSRCTA